MVRKIKIKKPTTEFGKRQVEHFKALPEDRRAYLRQVAKKIKKRK